MGYHQSFFSVMRLDDLLGHSLERVTPDNAKRHRPGGAQSVADAQHGYCEDLRHVFGDVLGIRFEGVHELGLD